jgi:hypothetical protein
MQYSNKKGANLAATLLPPQPAIANGSANRGEIGESFRVRRHLTDGARVFVGSFDFVIHAVRMFWSPERVVKKMVPKQSHFFFTL